MKILNNIQTTSTYTLSLVTLMMLSPLVDAQVCNKTQTPQTVSARNFIDPDTLTPITEGAPASVKDVITGLIWNRCIYGQHWDADTQQCIGSPMLVTWSEALSVAFDAGWRVPNIKELNSILDLQCISPPFDLFIFPDTFASEAHGLWTSSPHVPTPDPENPITTTSAWYIDLSLGKMNYHEISSKNFVRFVKD
ncbi:MAG: DUF1566 domain-containing protein [Gammaproteobacteria bacterium]|nr:DUF1566 domain-containing protein [Gammaproteobacteria bacterium]